MQLLLITIFCCGAALAAPAPQRPVTESKDSADEMVIRLVLHVKRSDEGTQLVIDLAKSQESSEVVRPKPKPIASLSTTLPIFAKNNKEEKNTSVPLLAEKSYEIPDSKKTTESNPYVVVSQTKRSIAADTSDRAAANGYINLRPQNVGTSPTDYQHNRKQFASAKDEQQSKPKESGFVIQRLPVTSRPKLDFKITLGGPTTERPQRFNPSKIVFPVRETPTEEVRTHGVTEPSKPGFHFHDSERTTEHAVTEKLKPSLYYHYDTKTQNQAVTEPQKPASYHHYDTEGTHQNQAGTEPSYKPPLYDHYDTDRTTAQTNTKPAPHHNDTNSTESHEEMMPEIELIDKAVADQGFGVLASRCESFAPGLVSDGAGGCTRPIARPKNKNYQGTYAYRSAAGNELHADVKDAPEEAEVTTETTQVRVV